MEQSIFSEEDRALLAAAAAHPEFKLLADLSPDVLQTIEAARGRI